jgi:hypothetical protein
VLSGPVQPQCIRHALERLLEINKLVFQGTADTLLPIRPQMHATRTNQHMKTRISSIMTFAVLLFLNGCSKDPQPSASEIVQSLDTQLPAFARVSSFSIEAMQNIGTKVDPVWHARFRAKVKVLSDTFAPDGTVSGMTFLRVVKRNGEAIEMFGKSISKLYAGAWRTDFEFEGQPIEALGRPESAFATKRVVIHGTKAEQDYLAGHEAFGRALERQVEEGKKRLAEASKLLIGTWRDENSQCTFNEDGTETAIFDSGHTSKSKWSVDGDILTQTVIERDGQPVQEKQIYRSKILEITKGTFETKEIGDKQREWHATKIK